MSDPACRNVVVLPDGAAKTLRDKLGLSSGQRPRISYLSVASDTAKALRDYWEFGFDPAVPKATFGCMFFELIEKLEAEGQLFSFVAAMPFGEDRIRVDKLTPPNRVGQLIGSLGQRRLLAELNRHLDRFDPHVVILSSSLPLAGWPRTSQGRRTIVYAHNALWRGSDGPSMKTRAAWRSLRTQLAGVLASSEGTAAQARGLVPAELTVEVARPQVPESPMPAPRERLRRVLYIGAIARSRGVLDLLDSVQLLQRKHPELELCFIGQGPEEAILKQRVATAPGVTFDPSLKADRIQAALASADLLVQASYPERLEGWAEFGAEAAAMGVPLLLSSAVPAAAYLNGAVKTYPHGKPGALTQALADLLDDPVAFRALANGFTKDRALIWDRSQSWGSLLGRLMLK